MTPSADPLASADAATPHIVISQVYGGGGNSGATLKNDFIELYNPGTTAVSLVGWSVQYASAAGTTWSNKTNLTGSIAAGGYYLVQEANGTGGTTALPTPNDVGTIAMSGTNAKVALVNNQTFLSGACPKDDASVIDFVGYGTGSSTPSCFEGAASAPTLSNTTAALRKLNGAQDTNNNGADFATGAPNPRPGVGGGTTGGEFAKVGVSGGPTVNVGQTITLTATLQDALGQPITDPAATFVWDAGGSSLVELTPGSGNTATLKGISVGGPAIITVNATSNGVTHAGTVSITVATAPSQISLSIGTTPLVVGYQTQIFINSGSIDKSGNAVNASNVTWSSSAPGIVSVDSHGLISAAGDGTAAISVTAADGSTSSFNVTTEVPFYSSTARTGHNVEFGTPTDADPSNDVIIERKQYTLSYNPQRGGPNWVSWDLNKNHIGDPPRNRCNCYTADTALVRLGYGQYMYNTLDYTNGGYDRGHMEPSADQTTTDGENATTFFLTNFLPQQHNLNAGPWENLENDLRDTVKAGREAYIIAGGIFTGGVGLGSIKNEGKIQIPDSTWKIVVTMPENTGLTNVTSATDLNVFVVNMPNVATGLSSAWKDYKTTVNKIQISTGYDFLSSLPEAIQCKVEQRNCAPTARITGSGLAGGAEGQALQFDASTSDDANGPLQRYEWSIDGQVVGTAPSLSYTFGTDGAHQVKLSVTDDSSATSSAMATVTVAEVAPSVGALSDAAISEGSSYTASGAFTDPGNDQWTATVDYGDGSGAHPLNLAGKTFSLAHVYGDNGTYHVVVTVADQGSVSGTSTATITVTNVPPAVASFAGATILRGEKYGSAGTFADPGTDSWTGTVNYGDGSSGALSISGTSFTLEHTYSTAGTMVVTVIVTDDDGGTGTRTAQVRVLSAGEGISTLASNVSLLASGGRVEAGDAKWIANKLDVAAKELARGNTGPSRNQLQQVVERLEAAQRAGRISADDATMLTEYVNRILAAM